MHWWVTDAYNQSPMLLVSWVFWVIVSICLHELAHGIAAIRLGDDTPIHTGHMTWNPMVHMGQTALIMFALFGFTWGLMPINPNRLRGRYGESIVAAAGPLCNALQFVVLMTAWVLWDSFAAPSVDPTLGDNVMIFLSTGAVLNLVGFVFNLIPMPPLDGSRIVGDIYPPYWRLFQGERGAVFGLVAFALLFFVGGSRIWSFAFGSTADVYRAAMQLLAPTP